MHTLTRPTHWFILAGLLCLSVPALADVSHRWDGASWLLERPSAAAASQVLFQGPEGQRVVVDFAADEAIRVAVNQLAALGITDGQWTYRADFEQAKDSAETQGRTSHLDPAPVAPITGVVVIEQGQFVTSAQSNTSKLDGPSDFDLGEPRQFIDDLLVVSEGMCVGIGCASDETLSFDTIKLKEDNLRISFIDSSSSAGFPAGDWQLRANESANGGANVFAIDWLGTEAQVGDSWLRTPFLVAENAPADALVVKGAGADTRLGLGTNNPGRSIHVDSSDSPALRLQQNITGGWGESTWDVAGNETNFFVRYISPDDTFLPFRIRPGAPTSSLDIAASGNVGVGITAPQAKLHVASGDLRVDGAIYQLSSSASKTPFERMSPASLLDKLSNLELGRWGYKERHDASAHFGPAAEDFFALFGLGGRSDAIAVSDMAGIALGASQALHDELKQKDTQIQSLETEVQSLHARLAALEQLVRGAAQSSEE